VIQVSAEEQVRKFNVSVGDKHVGRVEVGHRGWISAFAYQKVDGRSYTWLEGGFKTVSQAANRILRDAGYGNAKSCNVKRVKGFRS
jgi:hypothetical protein